MSVNAVTIPKRLYIIEFLTGAVVMIMELVGARILAPFLGTSIIVWTSIIGVILGSLAVGYWFGGYWVDSGARKKKLVRLLVTAGVLIALIPLLHLTVMPWISAFNLDVRFTSLLVVLLLFAPSSVVLGSITPTVTRIAMSSIDASGRTVGTLYATSTLGSICGTFLAGFVLILYLPNETILFSLSGIMIGNALLAEWSRFHREKITGALVVGLLMFTGLYLQQYVQSMYVLTKETLYNSVRIYDGEYNDKKTRFLLVNGEMDSAAYLDSNELVFDYTTYYRLAEHFNPGFDNALLIGGGAYSFPKYYLEAYPKARIDVVEIDSELTDIARTYFNLKESPRMNIFHEDGRTYLNKNTKKYDVVYIDAFRSYSVPFQLTTLEAVKKIYDATTDDGVVLMNIISSIQGDTGRFMRSEFHTYQKIFPSVAIYPVSLSDNAHQTQNIMLVASKRKNVSLRSKDSEINIMLSGKWKHILQKDAGILTDSYAPVEQYLLPAINEI